MKTIPIIGQIRMNSRWILFFSSVAVVMLSSCVKNNTQGTTAALASKTSLSSAYPTGLTVTLFPTSAGSALRLTENKLVADDQGDDCLPDLLKTPAQIGSSETCYEFDQDMIYGWKNPDKKLGTTNGLNANSEACLVAFSRSKVKQVADLVDRATGVIQAMFCQAKKTNADIALPEKGTDALDLAAEIKTAFGKYAKKINKATIKRLDDTEDGRALYKSYVEIVTVDGKNRMVTLIHSPGENGDYRGVMLATIIPNPANVKKETKNLYASIRYSQVSESAKKALNYELRSAQFDPAIENVFGADGQLDFNTNADFTVETTSPNYGAYKKADNTYYTTANEAMSGSVYITASVDADTGAGTMMYVQNPGGGYNESARGLVTELALDEADGVMKGCATSGAALGTSVDPFADGMSIRRSLKESATLAPKGFFHPFFNSTVGGPDSCDVATNAADEDGMYMQKTCMEPDAQSGESVPTTSKWYFPNISDPWATTFITDQNGAIITRQCFKLSDEKYAIDFDKIHSSAGYELIRTNDDASANNLIALPRVDQIGILNIVFSKNEVNSVSISTSDN